MRLLRSGVISVMGYAIGRWSVLIASFAHFLPTRVAVSAKESDV
jgi:hypothetical protein